MYVIGFSQIKFKDIEKRKDLRCDVGSTWRMAAALFVDRRKGEGKNEKP